MGEMGDMGENGGKWGACACACAYVSPFSEGVDLPAPLVFSLSVRSYVASYTPTPTITTSGNAQSRNHCIATVGCGGMHASHDTQVPPDWHA